MKSNIFALDQNPKSCHALIYDHFSFSYPQKNFFEKILTQTAKKKHKKIQEKETKNFSQKNSGFK